MTLANHYDVAVIGAGPSGLVAATELAMLGIPVVVIDEQASPGGQIYRAITTTPVARITWRACTRRAVPAVDSAISNPSLGWVPSRVNAHTVVRGA